MIQKVKEKLKQPMDKKGEEIETGKNPHQGGFFRIQIQIRLRILRR